MTNQNLSHNLSLQDLANLIITTKNDLCEQINSMRLRIEEKINNEISTIKKDIDNIHTHQTYIEEKVEKIERQLHLTDLLMYGIPKDNNENLSNLLQKFCNNIGFNAMGSSLLSIFRINLKSEKPPIVLKFISFNARNQFYNSYIDTIKNKHILLNDIGINGTNRIIVQESLSSFNAALFRKSMELKTNDLIYSVHTKNGFVKIKARHDAKAIIVSSIQQLLEISEYGEKITRNKRKFGNIVQPNSSLNDPKISKQNSHVIHSFTLNDLTDSTLTSTKKITQMPPRIVSTRSGTLDK